MVKKYQR